MHIVKLHNLAFNGTLHTFKLALVVSLCVVDQVGCDALDGEGKE